MRRFCGHTGGANFMQSDSGKPESWKAILFPDSRIQIGWLTSSLGLLAILVTVCSGFNFTSPFSQKFFITQFVMVNGGIGWKSGLPEICSGQVWRLWSTFFLHTGWSHLLGNVFWFALMGNYIEKRHGSLTLAGMVFFAQPSTSLFQYLIHGPFFTGMSGTLAFMFAYLWLRGVLSPKLRIGLHPYVIGITVVWQALVFAGLMGPRAGQASHAAGLILGFAWAFIAASVEKLKESKTEH
jgi:membrane associated rhomboid family serine protease